MGVSAGAVISILILAACAAAVFYVWLRSYRWMRQDHSRPVEKDPEESTPTGEAKPGEGKSDSGSGSPSG